MGLARERTGSGTRLVLLHGFTQTSRSWARVAPLLADYEVVSVDAPGHGDSASIDADLWGAGDLLVDAGGEATYVGYSMGARIALHAALSHPDSVRRLVLIGATPGLRSSAERNTRRAGDEELARFLEREGLEVFLERWLANPLFAHLDHTAALVDDRLRNTVSGLARSLRRTGTGQQDDLWPRLAELRMPVLLVAGALDTKFASIAGQMASAIGANAERALIPSAGHAVHLERPAEFADVLRRWLERTETALRR